MITRRRAWTSTPRSKSAGKPHDARFPPVGLRALQASGTRLVSTCPRHPGRSVSQGAEPRAWSARQVLPLHRRPCARRRRSRRAGFLLRPYSIYFLGRKLKKNTCSPTVACSQSFIGRHVCVSRSDPSIRRDEDTDWESNSTTECKYGTASVN
jgi:hypothetical protein